MSILNKNWDFFLHLSRVPSVLSFLWIVCLILLLEDSFLNLHSPWFSVFLLILLPFFLTSKCWYAKMLNSQSSLFIYPHSLKTPPSYIVSNSYQIISKFSSPASSLLESQTQMSSCLLGICTSMIEVTFLSHSVEILIPPSKLICLSESFPRLEENVLADQIFY